MILLVTCSNPRLHRALQPHNKPEWFTPPTHDSGALIAEYRRRRRDENVGDGGSIDAERESNIMPYCYSGKQRFSI